MTALIGTIGGLLTGVGTGVINVIKEKNANEAAVARARAEAETARMNAEAEAVLIRSRSDADIKAMQEKYREELLKAKTESATSARAHDTAIQVDSKWANVLRVIIRPLWALVILALFSLAKVCVIIAAFRLIAVGTDPLVVAGLIMDEPTTAIMATITGFYFGQRYGEKMASTYV